MHDPIYTHEILQPVYDRSNPLEEEARPIDRAMATFISSHLSAALREWRDAAGRLRSSESRHSSSRQSLTVPHRRPKAIVFSQHGNDLDVSS